MPKPWEAFKDIGPWSSFEPSSEYVGDTSGRSVADMQREFIQREGKTKFNKSDIIKEPLKIAGEMAAGLANIPIKAAKGLMGLGTAAMSGYQGGSLDEALRAGTESIGNRNVVQSPFPSKTMGLLGENIISPAISKTAELTGIAPENIAAVAEAGGDIATLFGLGIGKGSPVSVATNRAANIGKTAADTTANKLMDMTLKQSTTLSPEARAVNIKTALENNIMPSKTGQARLDAAINEFENRIASGLQTAENQGITGSLQGAIQNVDDLRTLALTTGNPAKNMRLIDQEIKRIQNNPNIIGWQPAANVPIETLQQMKVMQGKELQKKYGQFQPNEFQTTIDKARVRGLKDELQTQLDSVFPELAETNKKLGSYYQLKKQLDRAVNRIENRQGVGIDLPIKTGGGAAVGGPVGAAIGAAVGVIEHPMIAPLLARQLYKINRGKITQKEALQSVNDRLKTVTTGLITSELTGEQ